MNGMNLLLGLACLCGTFMVARGGHLIMAMNNETAHAGLVPEGDPTQPWDIFGGAQAPPGWGKYTFVMCNPCGIWYVVLGDKMYMGFRPEGDKDNFLERAQYVGEGWGDYKFAFFHHTGDFYAITKDGEFRTRYVQLFPDDHWHKHAKRIGTGWDVMQFVLFDAVTNDLLAVKDNKLYRAPEPKESTDTADKWVSRAVEAIDFGDKDILFVWCDRSGEVLHITADGNLYITVQDEKNVFGKPKLISTDNWDQWLFVFSRV